jgi:hypothetical protein
LDSASGGRDFLERNTKEWDKGYVVFKGNIRGSAGGGEGARRRLDSARPHLFLQQTLGRIFKDDVNGFSSTSDICVLLSMLVHRVSSVLKEINY